MMLSLRIFTTLCIVSLMMIVFYFLMNVEIKDKGTIFGFSFMEMVYILSLVCIWG